MPTGLSAQRQIFTVSRLNREARFLLEKSLSTCWVEGEISNLSRPTSGHLYFTLKDQQAQIRCALFRNRRNLLRFQPENGAQVQIRGTVSLYEARGDYQLIAEHMEPAGEGALQQAFEQLKKKLQLEGLFDPQHKQPVPSFPKRVGIISSPSGAAIHDILTVLKRRFPSLPVILYPTAVQGSEAVEGIIGAIKTAQQRSECDLLVLARGGGSIEDLWSFNEEAVARAIYDCEIPTISAVGHETDFTIADFAADQRAPTPSAAAESISPDQEVQAAQLQQLGQRLQRTLQREIQARQIVLKGLERRLRHPREKIHQFSQRLDEQQIRLQRAIQMRQQREQQRLRTAQHTLLRHAPERKIQRLQKQLQAHGTQLTHAMRHQLQHHGDRLAGLGHTLDALSPLSTLSRGYSITATASGIVRQANQLNPGDQIKTRLHSGNVLSKVIKTEC